MIPNIKMTYNGKNPEDFGVCVTAVTTRKPTRKYYAFDIPGRNGVLKEMLRVWDNTTVDVSFAILGESSGDVIEKCDTMMEWLTEPNGYARLELSTDPDVYRMATVSEDFEISDVLAKTDEATVSFDCMPQRFLKSGELPVAFTDSSKSQQTIYKYSDFSSYTKTNIIDPISAEIGMDLSDNLFYVVDMSGVTLADDEMIRVEGGFDKFFVALCSNNPVSSSSNASGYRLDDTFLLHQYDPRAYWLFPAAANIKIYAEDTLVYESPNTEHETMHNQTMFGAKPLVKVDIADGDSITDYLFSIGPNGVLFTQPDEFPYNRAQTITIDCEAMEAYSLPRDNPAGYKVNWNPYVTFVKAPELMPGDNDIAYDATVSNLRIIPRWWRL